MQEKETKWKMSLLLFSIYLCFFIFLTSCDTDKNRGIPEFQDESADVTPGNISDSLVARIYFDATLSMQGFVVPSSTRYTQICPYLESVIVSGWEDEKIDFFRFGEQVEPIDRNGYLQAGHADFYEQENIYRETFIQKIIDYEDQRADDQIDTNSTPEASTGIEVDITPEASTEVAVSTEEIEDRREEGELVVIVTDLFQDRGDINLLVAQLKEKYIQNGLEVGLLGLRSQFDGTVYDTGIGQAPLPYQSDPNNSETFRPFYLLVLGKHTNIAHYFDKLITSGFSEAETVIFSRYLVSPLLSFGDAQIEKLENLVRDTIAKKPDSRLKEYRIRERNEPSKISAKMKYELLPYVMPFDSNTFEPSADVDHNRTDSSRRSEISQAAQNCLEVTSTFGNGDELIVDFELDSRVLARETAYLYKVALHPRIDTYQVPEWCSEWDMGTGRNGAKTLNLVNFVDGLTQITVREHQPKIAQFYFCVEKR